MPKLGGIRGSAGAGRREMSGQAGPGQQCPERCLAEAAADMHHAIQAAAATALSASPSGEAVGSGGPAYRAGPSRAWRV